MAASTAAEGGYLQITCRHIALFLACVGVVCRYRYALNPYSHPTLGYACWPHDHPSHKGCGLTAMYVGPDSPTGNETPHLATHCLIRAMHLVITASLQLNRQQKSERERQAITASPSSAAG
jgi:hypothetical protein